ncbi:MAG: hypothetical protein AB1405_08775 [Bdellovibrionota bacterium]
MQSSKWVRGVFVGALLASASACGAPDGEPGGPDLGSSPDQTDGRVSACCTIDSPRNQVSSGQLVPINPGGTGRMGVIGTVLGRCAGGLNGTTVVNRIVVFMDGNGDNDYTDAGVDFVVLDSGKMFDTLGGGTDTDPDVGAATLCGISNDGFTSGLNPMIGATCAAGAGGGWVNPGGSSIPSGAQPAYPAVAGNCAGVRASTGGSGRSWQAFHATAGGGVITATGYAQYRVEFFNEAGALIDSNTSRTFPSLASPPLGLAGAGQLHDLVTYNDSGAPTVTVSQDNPSGTGVLTTGMNLQPLPFSSLSVREVGTDLSYSPGAVSVSLSERSFRASNAQTGDMLTISNAAAVAQVDQVDVTAVLNSTLYTVTINGTANNFTSDASATADEIRDGLIGSINGGAQAPNVTAAIFDTDSLRVTSDLAGVPYTISVGANLATAVVTNNQVGTLGATRILSIANATNYARSRPSTADLNHYLPGGGTDITYEIFHSNVNVSVAPTGREREANAGVACIASPAAGTRCALDANFDIVRGGGAAVQGRVNDADNNVNSIKVKSISTTNPANPQQIGTIETFLQRDITLGTYDWLFDSTNGILFVDKAVGDDDNTEAPQNNQLQVQIDATDAAYTGLRFTAGPPAIVEVDLSELPHLTGAGAGSATVNEVIDAINIGIPRYNRLTAGASDFTFVALAVPESRAFVVTLAEGVDNTPTTTVTYTPATLTISVDLADTAGAGGITATGAQVAAAINSHGTVGALIRAVVRGAPGLAGAGSVTLNLGNVTNSNITGKIRASLAGAAVGTTNGTAVAVAFGAPTALAGGLDPKTTDAASPGRLVSTWPTITVGQRDWNAPNLCLPPGLNVLDNGATALVNEAATQRDVCFAASVELSEGRTRFEVDSTDGGGNLSTGAAANQLTQDVALDTAPAFLDTDANTTPAGITSQPSFCPDVTYANEPVCLTGATVGTAGDGVYESFGVDVGIGGKIRDFIPGTSTYDTTAVWTDAAATAATVRLGDSGRAHVRVVTDNGFDSASDADGLDDLGNPIPYVNGDTGAGMGEFNFLSVPLRLGGTTSVTITIWDQAGNISSYAFTIVQIPASTDTIPSFALDCVVDGLPKQGATNVPCAEDTASPNPNSPINLRAGFIGSLAERGDDPVMREDIAGGLYTNNLHTRQNYFSTTGVTEVSASAAAAAQSGTMGAGGITPLTAFVGCGNLSARDNGSGAFVGDVVAGGTIVYATGVWSLTFTAACSGAPNSLIERYNTPKFLPLAHDPDGAFSPFSPTSDQAIVSTDRVTLSGRTLARNGMFPEHISINGDETLVTPGDVQFDVGAVGGDINFNILHGYQAGGVYPAGFFTTVSAHNPQSNLIVIPAVATHGTPQDDSTSQTDEQLRVGDALVLSLSTSAQASNEGLYRIVALADSTGADCDPLTVPANECVQVYLDRSLPVDGDGMFVQAEYIWSARNVPVPSEGLNAFVFAAVDSLGNTRQSSFTVLRDTQPPSIVVQGVVSGFETFSATPEVFLTDSTLFLGGINTASLPTTGDVPLGNTYIAVSRTDSNGLDEFAGNRLAYEYGFIVLGDDFSTPALDPANAKLRYDISDDDGFPGTGPLTIPTVLGNGAPPDWPASATAIAGFTPPSLSVATVLGSTFAASANPAPSGTPADPLDGDPSCRNSPACAIGTPMAYTVAVRAFDLTGQSANTTVSFQVVESAETRLLGGAMGLISGNPQVINLIADNTDLSNLSLDQISLSGVLFNTNSRLAQLLGGPNDQASTNPRAFEYNGPGGSREAFGNLLGTILEDQDGGGPGQSTAVTLANVLRILMDNGVTDDLLPILDNVQILDPRTGAGTARGDMSLSTEFMRNLVINQSGTAVPPPVTCGTDTLNGTARTCYHAEGIIKESFPAIKATLDFGDLITNQLAGFALRYKETNGATASDLDNRLSGDQLDLQAGGVSTDDAVDTSAGASFLPIDGTDVAPVQGTCNGGTPGAICKSVVNVQPGDIVVITSGVCAGIARKVVNYPAAASRNTLVVEPFPTASPDCLTACTGAAGNCTFRIVHPNGPALIPAVELADLLAFTSYDNQNAAGTGTAETLGGEREFLQALLAAGEELLLNPTPAGPVLDLRNRSLVCPFLRSDLPSESNANGGCPRTTDQIDNSEGLQAFMDLFSELADDAGSQEAAARSDPDGTQNGVEFISQVIKIVNELLKDGASAAPSPAPPSPLESTYAEALVPIAVALLNNNDATSLPAAYLTPNGLLATPTTGGFAGRRDTRLNLLLRGAWWMGEPLGAPSIDVDVNGDGTADYPTQRGIIPLIALVRNLADDPDDNPRGILSQPVGADTPGVGGFTLRAPGTGPQRSIGERLLGADGPVNLLLRDERLDDLLNQISSILDPGTGVSDLAAFQSTGTVSEYPTSGTQAVNPYTINPPLLRILSELTAATIDVDMTGTQTGLDEQPTEPLTRAFNLLLTSIGPDDPSLDGQPDVDQDADGNAVNTPICNESFFRGRTPAEIMIDILAQMLNAQEKDPKDFDVRERTFPDYSGSAGNRTLLRILLDGLFDDPAAADMGGTAVNTNTRNAIDDFPTNPCANQEYEDFSDGICNDDVIASPPSGTRGPRGGDRLAVAQQTLDILPELFNTVARFGFDFNEPSEPLVSIFENCTGGFPVNGCAVNAGIESGPPGEAIGASGRLLSNLRLLGDIGLQLDQPMSVGSGGFFVFDQSVTRQFLESISNLDNANAVNQILLLFAKLEEDTQPITGTTSIPNPDDIAKSASAVRALGDPDGDGDPTTDGVLDDLVPIIQLIPASGQTQQILDLIRAIRTCGYAGAAPQVDVKGGNLMKTQENVLLIALDHASGQTNPTVAEGGTATCPSANGRGGRGGVLDSNPLFNNDGDATSGEPVASGDRSGSGLGVIVGGNRGELVAAGASGCPAGGATDFCLRDTAKDFRTLGVGSTTVLDANGALQISNAHVCVTQQLSPYNEICAEVRARPPVSPNANLVPFTDESIRRSEPGAGPPDDLSAFMAACLAGSGNYCSYRIRQIAEPFNGCKAGAPIANEGLGRDLSSFALFGGMGTPNAFRDSRLDLLLRSADFLADEGNIFGTQRFLDRIESLLSTAIKDPLSGDQSIAKNFLFGPAGVGGSEEGPVQAMFNDTKTRKTLSSFLTLFARLTNRPANPAGTPEVQDTYPDSNWGGACGGPLCDGNGIHDAVDYQLVALRGPLGVLGDSDGLDNGPVASTGCDVFGRLGAPNIDSSNLRFDGHCDDPEVLFLIMSQFIQADLITDLLPGVQIIAEATSALGDTPNLSGNNGSALFTADPNRDERTRQIRANETLLDREMIADVWQRLTQAENGDAVIWSLVDDELLTTAFPGAYPCNRMGAVLEDPGQDCAGAATDGVLEGPQQILLRGIFQMLLEYTSDTANGVGIRRGRFTGLEDLVARITGARSGDNRLNQALRIVREITMDRDTGTCLAGAPNGCDERPRTNEGTFPGERDSTGAVGSSRRAIGPILSLQAGLARRNIVDLAQPSKSAMDVIADFMNTLIEDPTDCDGATAGIQRGGAGADTPPDECEVAEGVDAVFRDVGVLVERPVQPIFDQGAFDSLSGLFPASEGQSSTLSEALPFISAVFDDQLQFLGDESTNRFTEYVDYQANPADADRVADALLADIQRLIPNTDLARFDPLLTDDLNRDGVLNGAGFAMQGTGTSSPLNDLDSDCTQATTLVELDNLVINCHQGAATPNGSTTDDWGNNAATCANQRCDVATSTPPTNIGANPTIRAAVGFTSTDNVVTVFNVSGIDAALLDGLADVIANENPAFAVNNQSNRTTTARQEDTFTQRTVNSTQAVDPNFISLITGLGDLLIESN